MMRQAIALVCCLIVGLEVVVGLAGVVGGICLIAFGGASLGPVSVQVHAGHEEPLPASGPVLPLQDSAAWTGALMADTVEPPMNVVPDFSPAPGEASIVSLREGQGSLLAGTVLGQGLNPTAEQDLFVGALRQVAAEGSQAALLLDPPPGVSQGLPGAAGCTPIPTPEEATLFAIERLYEMADIDERAGEFERSDQWRSLARGLRQTALAENPARPEPLVENAADPAESDDDARELD
jgi:hypothetical protein